MQVGMFLRDLLNKFASMKLFLGESCIDRGIEHLAWRISEHELDIVSWIYMKSSLLWQGSDLWRIVRDIAIK